jgi:hypothetical protein
VDSCLESGDPPPFPKGGGEEGVRRLAFAVAPLSRVMLRHTRPLLELYRRRGKLTANLARRVVLPLMPIAFTAQEQAAYDRLEGYCLGLATQLGKGSQGKKASFALGMTIWRRFGKPCPRPFTCGTWVAPCFLTRPCAAWC